MRLTMENLIDLILSNQKPDTETVSNQIRRCLEQTQPDNFCEPKVYFLSLVCHLFIYFFLPNLRPHSYGSCKGGVGKTMPCKSICMCPTAKSAVRLECNSRPLDLQFKFGLQQNL